ncbi:MAG: PLP-dependent aminotransferase family protein [Anaerovoracaceae bacterium]|jgi:GntR family transcriptional regulator/MocR family aminotransferase
MISLTPILNEETAVPLYQQLFGYIRDAILNRDILPGEKLPSLRSLSRSLNISITTVELAYNQLLVEGYISSRPRSGYFVSEISPGSERGPLTPVFPGSDSRPASPYSLPEAYRDSRTYVDPECFDFAKWKKCNNKILNDYSSLLLVEGDIQGEAPLRDEISRYIYQARGVRCNREQVVIAAGTQQLVNILCIILQRMGIDHASFEDPGYLPVRSIFKDRNFKMTLVPIDKDGIQIEKLPENIPTTVYVSPSNQFPTGSIMPAGRRYALLDWAYRNKSIIIEDDYNSELRYDSRPVPSLQGLDTGEQVVYLGSFSSTLFPSAKISYMVLPKPLLQLFRESLSGYTQTCSKAEQLTLALYMSSGYYQTNLRRQRKRNAQKIHLATAALNGYGGDTVQILNNSSGLHMLLKVVNNGKTTEEICAAAAEFGLTLMPVSNFESDKGYSVVMLYYTRIPIENMDEAIRRLLQILR